MGNPKIQYEDTFKNEIRNGCNLFLGAGFSVLAKNRDKNFLPIGNELRDEIADRFNKNKNFSLPQLCQILENSPNYEDLKIFLTNRYTINNLEDKSQKYLYLTNCKFKNIFTTNIDNLPYLIFDNEFTYLKDIRLTGPNLFDKHGIEYYPLHGSILTPEKGYNFNPISIGVQGSIGYFKDLSSEIRKSAFLFWGYSCADNNTITALYDNVNWLQTHHNKWILVLNEDDNEYFETLGFKIINGSTEDLLDYFEKNKNELSKSKISSVTTKYDVNVNAISSYRVPSINAVPSYPLANFFMGQHPQWSHILSNEIFKTRYYYEMENNINKGNNSIIIGIPVSGKSTLLMQLAASFKSEKIKLFFTEISLDQAKFVNKVLKGRPALIFLDRICNDVDAIEFLCNYSNIQLVGAEREYYFQLVSHRLRKIFSSICNISEIYKQDYRGIFDSIPNNLKKSNIIQTGIEKDNFSIFEFISFNVRSEEIKSRLGAAFKELTSADQDLLELFLMICYVNNCRTAVSYSMIYSFLNYETPLDWKEVYDRINQLGKLLKSSNYAFEWFDSDQDYYQPRSEHFSNVAIDTISLGDSVFRNVIERFHDCISPLNIPNYNTFKRYAFDSSVISKAYSKYEDGKEFYDKMFERDSSPYLLQQASLYMKHKKRFKDAFFYIDRALNMAPYNIFSIKNTHAQIIFAANINLDDCSLVRDTLDESMRILTECYEKDDRRIVHALIFSDQSKKYFLKYGNTKGLEYISLAKQWLKEEIAKNEWNKDLKRMLMELSNLV